MFTAVSQSSSYVLHRCFTTNLSSTNVSRLTWALTDRQSHIPILLGISFSLVCLPSQWRDGIITLLVELVRLVLVVNRELVV
jgi:hypothetical protein